MSPKENKYLIQLVYASLEIQNNTNIFNQTSLVSAYLSSVSISDSNISEIELLETGLEIVTSNLTLSNITISKIINNIGTDFILAISHSEIFITDTIYNSSELHFDENENI